MEPPGEEIELSPLPYQSRRVEAAASPTSSTTAHPPRYRSQLSQLESEDSKVNSSMQSSQTLPVSREDLLEPKMASAPDASFLRRARRRLIAFGLRLRGPKAGPHPLPTVAPLLTLSYTAGHYWNAWRPDETFKRHYLSKLRRWSRRRPGHKGVVVFLFLAAWLVGFAFLVKYSSFMAETLPSTEDDLEYLSCTSVLWSADDGCGLDGEDCLSSISSTSKIAFRCPAGCASQLLYNYRSVGALRPYYVPLVVGGGDSEQIYRADSFICAAAVHAGAISDKSGGCGIVNLKRNITYFPSSTAHGIESIPFPTNFPLGFNFQPCQSRYCKDLRWEILAFNLTMMTVFSLLLNPAALVFFWTMVSIGYWHVGLVSDPRSYPPGLSSLFGDFLPSLFVAYGFWRVAFRFTLPAFSEAPLERAIWFVGALWPGILLNEVSKGIPIDSLTSGSFGGDGATTWVGILIAAVIVLVLNQAVLIWRTGWLPLYAGWTIAGVIVIVILNFLPGLTFRLHHYIFSILFMPALGFATRCSAALQALLLGLYVNGVAKFSFDSIVQTADELRRDGILGSTIPTFASNASILATTRALLVWDAIPANLTEQWDGFSLLVDDVERYIGTRTNYSLAALATTLPHFFRLAYQNEGVSGDYTRAATLWPNGTWVDASPGAS